MILGGGSEMTKLYIYRNEDITSDQYPAPCDTIVGRDNEFEAMRDALQKIAWHSNPENYTTMDASLSVIEDISRVILQKIEKE
jgi:hypothetical protein